MMRKARYQPTSMHTTTMAADRHVHSRFAAMVIGRL